MTDWMGELAAHYENLRRTYPDDDLCVVFDIDGTILDMRHLVVDVLLAYDRNNGTEHFRGLRSEEVTVHENRIDDFLNDRGIPSAVREQIASWYGTHLWDPESILAGSRPYRGVMGVIRWFQLQPNTVVALNSGRPEHLRALTLETLNPLGRAHRVTFPSDLLFLNPHGWGSAVGAAKVAGIRRIQELGLRVVAVVDNEPANIRAMADTDYTREILFLHADTIFESQREPTPRTVSGRDYELTRLVSQEQLARRVEFVWHGVNDEANLRQFLASGVRWAECDVRRDPLGHLVLRHDCFSDSPWSRAENPLRLEEFLSRMVEANRAVKLDIKDGNGVIDRVLKMVEGRKFAPNDLWFNGSIEVVGEEGIRQLSTTHPKSTISVPIDFLAPLSEAAPHLATSVLNELSSWGVNRASIDWRAPNIRNLLGGLDERGWEVNIYGVPDLEAFLEAALLLPRSVTADFNFPDWHYYGRGSGELQQFHTYGLRNHLPAGV